MTSESENYQRCPCCGASPDDARPGCLMAELAELRMAANSARVLIERHRATRGSSELLSTALAELDDVLPIDYSQR